MRVIVTGGTGFVGPTVAARLQRRGHDVVVFTRDASRSRDHVHPNVKVVSWADGAPLWEGLVDGAGAIVNLAGESVAQRWTAAAKARIRESRLGALERLRSAVEKAKEKPRALVSASAVGLYGPHGEEDVTEASPAGNGFLAETCVAWEAAADRFASHGLRVAKLRIGMVLGADGGALAKMLPPFRAGLGAPLGSGAQWISWIHRDDLADLFVFAVENESVAGVLNATAPNPIRMRDFAKALGKALRRPVIAPAVPAFALKAVLGEMSTAVLDGARVLPKRTEELGFAFRHGDAAAALAELLG